LGWHCAAEEDALSLECWERGMKERRARERARICRYEVAGMKEVLAGKERVGGMFLQGMLTHWERPQMTKEGE
jgi:hypothetical protein